MGAVKSRAKGDATEFPGRCPRYRKSRPAVCHDILTLSVRVLDSVARRSQLRAGVSCAPESVARRNQLRAGITACQPPLARDVAVNTDRRNWSERLETSASLW